MSDMLQTCNILQSQKASILNIFIHCHTLTRSHAAHLKKISKTSALYRIVNPKKQQRYQNIHQNVFKYFQKFA